MLSRAVLPACAVLTASVSLADVELQGEIWRRPGSQNVELNETLQIHFIDVGGGDGILIDTPAGKKILIDGGWSYKDRGIARYEYRAYLAEFLGSDTVDLMVVSHPDYDHFAGLQEVLETRTVRQVWSNGYEHDELSNAWGYFLDAIEEQEDTRLLAPLTDYFELGSVIRVDDAGTFDAQDDLVLTLINSQQSLPSTAYGSSPPRSMDEGQRRNSCSIVLRLDYGETSVLLTGDTNGRKKDAPASACDDQELFMVRNNENEANPLFGLLDCDILKVAHHGSDGSSSLRFLQAVTPDWAIASAGVHYGHPTDGVLDRLSDTTVGLQPGRILRTDYLDPDTGANSQNLGDDCYRFYIDTQGVVLVERWEVNAPVF